MCGICFLNWMIFEQKKLQIILFSHIVQAQNWNLIEQIQINLILAEREEKAAINLMNFKLHLLLFHACFRRKRVT